MALGCPCSEVALGLQRRVGREDRPRWERCATAPEWPLPPSSSGSSPWSSCQAFLGTEAVGKPVSTDDADREPRMVRVLSGGGLGTLSAPRAGLYGHSLPVHPSGCRSCVFRWQVAGHHCKPPGGQRGWWGVKSVVGTAHPPAQGGRSGWSPLPQAPVGVTLPSLLWSVCGDGIEPPSWASPEHPPHQPLPTWLCPGVGLWLSPRPCPPPQGSREGVP